VGDPYKDTAPAVEPRSIKIIQHRGAADRAADASSHTSGFRRRSKYQLRAMAKRTNASQSGSQVHNPRTKSNANSAPRPSPRQSPKPRRPRRPATTESRRSQDSRREAPSQAARDHLAVEMGARQRRTLGLRVLSRRPPPAGVRQSAQGAPHLVKESVDNARTRPRRPGIPA